MNQNIQDDTTQKYIPHAISSEVAEFKEFFLQYLEESQL